MSDDLLARLDDEIRRGICGHPLGDSPSDYWCSPACQEIAAIAATFQAARPNPWAEATAEEVSAAMSNALAAARQIVQAFLRTTDPPPDWLDSAVTNSER